MRAAQNGIVTATGILANSKCLTDQTLWLQNTPALDVGVHLNLTSGTPLSSEMRNLFSSNNHEFPNKLSIVKSILLGRIGIANIETEWRAQIERCLSENLNIQFLNSHEHVHMLPSLFKLTLSLANEYGIGHVRLATPELFSDFTGGAIIRDSAMAILSKVNQRHLKKPTVKFMGMGQSGRLDITYIRKCIARMEPGNIYELMCHPGYYNNEKVENESVLFYHDWMGELEALTHESIFELLIDNNVKLISYRDLNIVTN